MINIRYPKITGKTPEEKLAQVESYLRQLVDQLNWALPQIEQGASQKQVDSTQMTNSSQGRKTNGN